MLLNIQEKQHACFSTAFEQATPRSKSVHSKAMFLFVVIYFPHNIAVVKTVYAKQVRLLESIIWKKENLCSSVAVSYLFI